MASTPIASGIHSLGAHSALSNQNKGLCCIWRSLHHARFARGFLQQHYSSCTNLQFGGKKSTLLNVISNEDQPSNDDEEGHDLSSADDGFFQEFMGRQLLAMNVMWKFREQRSFPLTEEEYLLHLDDVANYLRCWGAVSYVRNTLAKTKERPRIGKAVSIFVDLDESGGRVNEWIYR